MSRTDAPQVRAAGGVVWERTAKGDTRILLVHRPRYDDWSLPKGKAENDERAEETALREVEEETGMRCELGREIGRTRYRDSRGRQKEVRYWLMEPDRDTGAFSPNDEVDEIRWCSPKDAVKLLSYDHDRRLITSVDGELE
ncbi:MAG TPA: NUDIX hydrolase [Acidimicrobiia bacterium]|nr:NUDIX hydrolase [Acidimicrobiia bacterium]